jgi:glycosyltransferase 2 family protein
MKLNHIITFFKLLLTGIFFWIAINKIDIKAIIVLLKTINIYFLFFAIALIGIQLSLSSLRWFLVNKLLKLEVSFKNILTFTFIGQFFNQILPSSIGGDAVKILALSKSGLSLSRSTSSIFCDRFVGLLVLILIIFFALMLVPENWNLNVTDIKTFIYFFIAFIFMFIFILKFCIKYIKNISIQNKLLKLFFGIANDLFSFFSSFKQTAIIILLSLIIQLITIYVFYIIFHSISSDVSFENCFILIPVVMLVSMLPISFAGWGLREVALVVAFEYAGIENSYAMATSILFGLMQIIWAFPGLFFITARKNLI